MSPRIRTSIFLAFAAASFTAPNTASAFVPKPQPADIIDTGQSFDQTWSLIDWDAKRDSALGNVESQIQGTINSVNGTLNLLPGSPGLKDPGINADVGVIVKAEAYARHDNAIFSSSASTGLHAEATVNTALYLGALNQSFNGGPSVTFDASYVKPGVPFCLRAPCAPQPAPYYHVSMMVRHPLDTSYSSAIDFTQPDPLSGNKAYFVLGDPNMPTIDFGLAEATLTSITELLPTATYALNPTGGDIDFRVEGYSVFSASATKDIDVNVVGQDVGWAGTSADLGLNLLRGPNSTNAVMEAKANLYARHNVFGNGGSICFSAQGSLTAADIGTTTLNARIDPHLNPSIPDFARNALPSYMTQPTELSKTITGVGFSKTVPITPPCISF